MVDIKVTETVDGMKIVGYPSKIGYVIDVVMFGKDTLEDMIAETVEKINSIVI